MSVGWEYLEKYEIRNYSRFLRLKGGVFKRFRRNFIKY